MSTLSTFVSLHPYFKVHPWKLEAVKAKFSRFVEKTGTEKKNLFYGFTVNGDEILCREAYTDAEGVLEHLDNVGDLLAEMLTMSDLTRVEARPGRRAGKVEKATRAPQSGVVRDRARKKIRSEKRWKGIGTQTDNFCLLLSCIALYERARIFAPAVFPSSSG